MDVSSVYNMVRLCLVLVDTVVVLMYTPQAIYSMKVSIAAILSNTWYSQTFRYLAILADM